MVEEFWDIKEAPSYPSSEVLNSNREGNGIRGESAISSSDNNASGDFDGREIHAKPIFISSALALIFLSSGGFAAISILVASLMKTRERFIGIGQAIIMPLFFASSLATPISFGDDATSNKRDLNI